MGALMMTMTIGGFIAAAVSLIFAVLTGKQWLKDFVMGGIVIWLSIYSILFFDASISSEEQSPQLTESKASCGFYLNFHLDTLLVEATRQLSIENLQLDQNIKSDKTIKKEFVYDITAPARKIELSITKGYGINKIFGAFLIGDEDSFTHKKIYFQLEPQSQIASK